MALYVNTNASSLNAQRQLLNSGNTLDTAFKRLSSGLRINSAADDAAGLQISSRLTSQIKGLEQGNRNANDGISIAQTAEGAMDEMTNMLQRMRTLSQQAANGSNQSVDRKALNQEMTQLREEIDRIASDTTFGGVKLLDGSYESNFQVGADANQTIKLSLKLEDDAGFSLSEMAKEIDKQNGHKMSDTEFTDFASKKEDLANKKAAYEADKGDATKKTAFETAQTAFEAAGKALDDKGAISHRFGDEVSIGSEEDAQAILGSIDKIIGLVDSKRAELGAVQNRFQSTIRNQSNISENLSAARSRIQDTDFATETAKLTKAQILRQASTSILAQANQKPQAALSLLG
ncbi:flagellin [Algicola sagamiensis]|uniref:flagellin n=1 Tax=Algicola sagamiensis TaxID=163869 RepID=UPI00037CE235|nr:flagellin [Algicola sagamiensis]